MAITDWTLAGTPTHRPRRLSLGYLRDQRWCLIASLFWNTFMIMTPEHPEWEVFCDKLSGPDACDFKQDEKGEYTWKCKGGTDKTFATSILQLMGLSEQEVQDSFRYFEEHGGYCDCEILFNVDNSGEEETDTFPADE
jgi:hypothetical protein